VQPKKQFLRLVEAAGQTISSVSNDDDLALEADQVEALNGPNAYSDFLRKHSRRPDCQQASAIGRLMGVRVRASDGSMQPVLTAGEREAIRSIKKRRKEWSRKISHIERTITAITALAENKDDPSTVIAYGAGVFLDNAMLEQMEFALNWLKRFAEESRRHDKGSRAKGPQLIGIYNQPTSGQRPDDG
jgi:hypothetical protein